MTIFAVVRCPVALFQVFLCLHQSTFSSLTVSRDWQGPLPTIQVGRWIHFGGEKEEINEMDLCRSGLRSVSRTSGPMASISLPPAIVFSLLLTTLFSSHPVLFSLKSDAHRCVCIGRRINRKDTTNTPATVFFCPVPFIYFDFTLQSSLPPSVMCSLFSDSFARTRRMLASRRPEFLLAVEIEPHSNCCSGGNQRTKSVIMDGTTVHSVFTEFWACHNHRNAFVFCN